MSRRCAAISCLCQRREGHRPLPRQHVGPFGISAEGAGRLPGQHPHISIDVEERESSDIARAILTGSADLGLAAEHALPDNIERIPFSEDRLVLVAARGDELANRRQVDFSEVVERDFVGLISSIALHAHISGHAARLGARLRFRARLNNFDAIGQMVAAGIGIARDA